VKKLLVFLIMLMVGAALFALPTGSLVTGEPSIETVETIQQVDVFAVVAVSPAVMQAENLCEVAFNNTVTGVNDYFYLAITDGCLSKEVSPIFGYSKAMGSGKRFGYINKYEVFT